MTTTRMVFDVESVGLAGEGFAVGWVVLEGDTEVDTRLLATPAKHAFGTADGRAWIETNVPRRVWDPSPDDGIYRPTPHASRNEFWETWLAYGGRSIELWGDTIWPVEARFLHQAVDDLRCHREMGGPFPLLDVTTLFRMAWARDPSISKDSPPDEPHNPLSDAKASARTLLMLLKALDIEP